MEVIGQGRKGSQIPRDHSKMQVVRRTTDSPRSGVLNDHELIQNITSCSSYLTVHNSLFQILYLINDGDTD